MRIHAPSPKPYKSHESIRIRTNTPKTSKDRLHSTYIRHITLRNRQKINPNQPSRSLWMAVMCRGNILDCFCSNFSSQSNRLPRCSPVQAWMRRHNQPPLRWFVNSWRFTEQEHQMKTRTVKPGSSSRMNMSVWSCLILFDLDLTIWVLRPNTLYVERRTLTNQIISENCTVIDHKPRKNSWISLTSTGIVELPKPIQAERWENHE